MPLQAVRGRAAQQLRTPVSQRPCRALLTQLRMCMAGAVEDERHFLLECEAYADLRAQHGCSMDAGDMLEAMAGDQRRLAKYLHAASRDRRERLAVRDDRDGRGDFAAD
jgi:hypothetical protein